MCHDGRFVARQYRDQHNVKLASVYRDETPARDAYAREARAGVVVYGSPLSATSATVVTPSEILDAYLERGEVALTEFDGGFVIVVLDEARGELIIVNDRMATHAVAYVSDNQRFAFAPEGKGALLAAAMEPRLDVEGALEFLSLGFASAERTLLRGVSLLPPAHVVRIVLRNASFTLEQYWDLAFREDRRLRRESVAASALFDVLKANVGRAAEAAEGGFDLLLTGGYDSRTLLALLEATGCLPRRTITWGVTDTIPASDPYIARRLALQFGVPFEFMCYDHDTFAEQAEIWTFVSEIGTDNLGNFAAGPGFLVDAGELAPAVFNGDQLLGSGGIPVSFEDAFEVGTGLPYRGLAPGLAAMVFPERREEVAELVRARLMRMAMERKGEPNKDIQDYLNWQTHTIRWLNAPMYHREPMLSPWRPLAHRSAIDLFVQLPASHRVDKRLLVRMLERCVPHVLREPINSANSLVDWSVAFSSRSSTGTFFRLAAEETLFLDAEIGTFFDVDAFRRVLTGFLETSQVPIERVPSKIGKVADVRRRFATSYASSLAIRGTQRAIKRLMGRHVGASSTRVLWRVVLVNLLLRVIHRGWFRTGAPWQATLERHLGTTEGWPAPAGCSTVPGDTP